MLLGVNIDHIAVLREARAINDPNPLFALGILANSGADQVTIHLREDRRHIHDEDARAIIKHSSLPVNLECSINEKMIQIALGLKPFRITLVPENRQEVTTEGGLDLEGNFKKIQNVINLAHQNDIQTSLFIDPNEKSILLAKELNSAWIELHTGHFSNIYAMLFSNLKNTHHCIKDLDLPNKELMEKYKIALKDLQFASKLGFELNLKIAAGHGINYQNIKDIMKISHIEELNIGQSIIARSVFVGLENAIKQLKELM